ncbi:MAG TPA: UvrD-helicase domain-containing protein, partial [Chroococcales cyanobacterium]
MSIPIFVHPSFLNKIALLSSQDRQAIYKCVEKLRNKQWDAGLRVKRLKGFSRRIWEARTDRGDRLLFTFDRQGVRLWELASHDDVERMNRRSFTEDSPFVAYPLLEDASSLQENESLSECIDRDLEEDCFLPIEIDQELWRPLDLEELLRLGRGEDLVKKIELRLTEEQKQLVERPGNILLSGTAGSGKTTVAVFRLLDLANRNSGKILYLAQNPWLVRYARDLFRELLPPDRREDENIWKHIFFKSVQEVAGEIFKEAPQPVGYPFFKLLFKRWPDRVLPPATAWSEIRSIVKGACLDPSRDFLDKESYLNIGKKRAPDLQEFRPELFRNAERYQKHLVDHRMLDAVDLIRRALRSLPSEERGGYAAILLDEVQDFTELHLELAFRLLDRSGTLFCTGDLNQVINPSGFRWEEVKKQFFRRSLAIPEMNSLSTNFRSAGSIVELSEGLLDFRQRLLGGLSERAQSACLLSGDIPGLIEKAVEKKEIFEAIRGMAGDSAVLVRSETEKERIFF